MWVDVKSLVVVGFFLAAGPVSPKAEDNLPLDSSAPLAKQVLQIFEKRCAKCHGPEGVRTTTRPNGDFETVMNLEKLVANPDLVVPGQPGESKLYHMVEDELMPDSEQDEAPLPQNEKELIRLWILRGSPTR